MWDRKLDLRYIRFSVRGIMIDEYHLAGTRRLEMKSLASSDTCSNASASNSHLECRMLFIVSVSLSPKNGERPLKLGKKIKNKNQREKICYLLTINQLYLHFCSYALVKNFH